MVRDQFPAHDAKQPTSSVTGWPLDHLSGSMTWCSGSPTLKFSTLSKQDSVFSSPAHYIPSPVDIQAAQCCASISIHFYT